MSLADLYIKSLPFLDKKWLKADLNSALRGNEDLVILWNNLIQDNEVSLINSPSVVNSSGNLSYIGDDGKHYCGVELLQCGCCTGYCNSTTNCNCTACQQLDTDDVGGKKLLSAINQMNSFTSSEALLDSWLWGPIPNNEQKSFCIKSLLSEQRDITLNAAANCLSASYLKQLLFVYDRYFTALARYKNEKTENTIKNIELVDTKSQKYGSLESPENHADKATFGLARIGTRAALNLHFYAVLGVQVRIQSCAVNCYLRL